MCDFNCREVDRREDGPEAGQGGEEDFQETRQDDIQVGQVLQKARPRINHPHLTLSNKLGPTSSWRANCLAASILNEGYQIKQK